MRSSFDKSNAISNTENTMESPGFHLAAARSYLSLSVARYTAIASPFPWLDAR